MTSPTPPADFRQHLLVETPEHVILDYEVAGVGSRTLASLLDHFILLLWIIALNKVTGAIGLVAGHLAALLMVVLGFISVWGYFAMFEGLRGGQTPGKRINGVRVVMDTGHPVSFQAAVLRNLLRVADFLPGFYFLGGVMVTFHPRARRLGDLVAGTIVVRDRPHVMLAAETVKAPSIAPGPAGLPRLADNDFRLLEAYQARQAELTPAARSRLAESLYARFGAVAPELGGTPDEILEHLLTDERNRRQHPNGRSFRSDSASRLIEAKRPRWTAFGHLADRAATQGLDSFSADELPAFAAAYREIAADLARARTYHVDPRSQAELERLVAAGHNVLYRDRRHTMGRVWHVVSREFPAAALTARRAILVSLCAFWLPAAAGYTLLRAQPQLAEEVLPESMLSRADAGTERVKRGQGYYEADSDERPLMAAEIITNNVQVAFICFAGGIFLGVGALLSLGFNGLILGALAGHFANRGLLGYLGRFVVGHGVLELNAICVAGAAGFLLGHALIAPGDLPRSDALRLAGRIAFRLVGLTVVMLLGAGTIEGLLSPSKAGWTERLLAAGVSGLLLVLYLLNGRGVSIGAGSGSGAGLARSSPVS